MNSDPNSLPLLGRCLIEASAGTGKTWTITGLVLRLLLGANPPGTPPAPARALREILIVTFTRAATEELRTRIRTRLRAARLAFASGGTAPEDDALIAELLAASAERERDHDRLHAAELELDLASIFTIHGFANRALKRNAFESGISFAADIAEDDALLVRRTIHDFWRERVYPLPALPAAQLLGRIDHAGFVTTVRNLLGRQGLQTLNAPAGSWQQLLATIDAEATRLLTAWRSEGPGFDAAIAETRLNSKGREALQEALPRMDAVLAGAASLDHETVHALSRDFLASELAKKKGNALPALTVFDIAQTLDEHGTALYRRLLTDALVELPRRLADAKDRSGQLGYDDLLRLLDAGLRGAGGARLAATIREQYPVALIDEFQDTDLRQWEVFSTIYSTADSALFLVGDPKQAIYAFRGADVHAYLRARSTVSERRSLPTNYRTVATLIDAVNALFTLRTDNDPFLAGDAMPFDAVRAAGRAEEKPLLLDGTPVAALTVLHLKAAEAGADSPSADPPATEEYRERMANAAANHLADLLRKAQDGRVLLGGHALRAGDIVCLVRDRHEARHFTDACERRGIACVHLSRDNVYASEEARDLHQALAALLEPGSERRLRAALGCALLGRNAAELALLRDDDARLLREQERFLALAEALRSAGVQATLRRLLFAWDVPRRLLARSDGERELTNCLHLIELLQAERESLDSDEALLARFTALIAHASDPARGEREVELLRLQSDAERVRIVTLHASKGLEYPLVYLPFTPVFKPAKEALFHRDDTHELCYDLAAEAKSTAAAQREQRAEDLRLFYVGITRAIHGCVLGVGDVRRGNAKESRFKDSAPGHLLDAETLGAERAIARLGTLPGTVLLDAEALPWCEVPAATPPSRPLAARRFLTVIERDWQASSYSALARHLDTRSGRLLRQPELRAETDAASPAQEHSIFNFPRGARHGSFLHALFEGLDFAAQADATVHAGMISRALQHAGYAADWLPALQQLLADVLDCALDDDALRLRSLQGSSGRHAVELGFEFPLAPFDTARLDALLAAHDPLARAAPALAFARVRGMLSGFIDLVFECRGRYYVVDYKSNHLGNALADYAPARLAHSIVEHRYDLQYALYTLALTRLLRQRLGETFDYERHVGGVYYLYLRGMRAAAGARHGVWYARPARELIEALDALCSGDDGDDD